MLTQRIWYDKLVASHPEIASFMQAVMRCVASPDHIESDPRPGRTRFYRRNTGPSRWLLVVVSLEQEPARIITAMANRKDPKQWKP